MECFFSFKEQSSVDIFSHLYVSLKEKIPTKTIKKKVIVIAGPTGVGKTKVSIDIAKIIGGEIISADSMQVYRHMDIGTAKATKEQREFIPHHMIDICDVSQGFNVVSFYNEAHKICKDILLRGKVPIIVGGSGFYIHAFLYGPPQGPPSVFEIRQNLEKQMEQFGPEVLYERLQMMDPQYAATITEKDKQKIIRALEIIAITKKPVSLFPKSDKIKNDIYDFRCWFLHMPREILYEKVEKRCEEMIENGLIEEVERLKNEGIEKNYSASQSIGYRQCLEFLKTNRSEKEKQIFIQKFKQATRNYVKRQFTWFQKEAYFRCLNLAEIEMDKALEYILQDYEQS